MGIVCGSRRAGASGARRFQQEDPEPRRHRARRSSSPSGGLAIGGAEGKPLPAGRGKPPLSSRQDDRQAHCGQSSATARRRPPPAGGGSSCERSSSSATTAPHADSGCRRDGHLAVVRRAAGEHGGGRQDLDGRALRRHPWLRRSLAPDFSRGRRRRAVRRRPLTRSLPAPSLWERPRRLIVLACRGPK
jgi:hypothetical protein